MRDPAEKRWQRADSHVPKRSPGYHLVLPPGVSAPGARTQRQIDPEESLDAEPPPGVREHAHSAIAEQGPEGIATRILIGFERLTQVGETRIRRSPLGVAVRQRLQHIRTPLCHRSLGYLDELISTPTVPLLHGAVDSLSVLERVVAFGIVHVDRLPWGARRRPWNSIGTSRATCSTRSRSGV